MSGDTTAETLDDAAFLAAVDRATLPGERFRHREHVRLAWLCIRAHGVEAGHAKVRDLIQRYAAALGATGKYHETQTRAWVLLVGAAVAAAPTGETFADFLGRSPELLEGRLLARYYRKETLDSPQARTGWVAPDVAPLP
ncbi:hypothetical protein LZ198_35020 [Myxococcus sp. K15C18031901]|uniref:hypothetical protein n=1 Tax=Myxococcus dinghuensis TaxID=2906761 RepID=UPI0020A8096B|nr:hypothetical protein [Myxococcus dinghuensis]MCP3104096.1 hypothetical protein [Myxococcus dinghuensis]